MKLIRNYLVKTHRYLGLTVGIFFVLLGLTGSILAFYPELDRLINPQLDVNWSGVLGNVELCFRNAKAVFPEKFLHSVFFASGGRGVHQVWFTPTGQDFSMMWEVLVNPDTAQVVGFRQAVPVFDFTREGFVNTIYTLHLLMFCGSGSYVVLGFCGAFLFVTVLIGLWIWWPTRRRLLLSLSVKRGASPVRRAFDLHRVFGFYGCILILVIAFSGFYLTLPEQVEAIAGVGNKQSAHPLGSAAVVPIISSNASDVVKFASSLVGDKFIVKSLWMPSDESKSWRIYFIDPENIGYSGSEVIVAVDAQSGAVSLGDYESDLPRDFRAS